MQNLLKFFLVIYFTALTALAQNEQTNIIFKAEMIGNGGTDQLIICGNSSVNEPIEGYFLIPELFSPPFEPGLIGEMQKGGFNFLDPQVYDVANGYPIFRKNWVKNDFPVTDLESLTNGINLSKAFSFYIIPEMRNSEDDSVTLFFKYAVYDNLNIKDHVKPNIDLTVKVFYKKVKVPFSKDLSFNFIDDLFKNYHLLFSINRHNNYRQELTLQNAAQLFDGIKNSASESKILKDVEINLSAELIKANVYNTGGDNPLNDIPLLRVKQNPLVKVESLNDLLSKEKINLPAPVYTAVLSFPFKFYNSSKQKEYEQYISHSEILKSTCNIVVVPISYHKDSLMADLYIDYSKLNLHDISRWTPIKKRITLMKGNGIKIDLPNENWTANFTRKGEHYNIYGYSDYEKYISEYLVLLFQSIELKGEN